MNTRIHTIFQLGLLEVLLGLPLLPTIIESAQAVAPPSGRAVAIHRLGGNAVNLSLPCIADAVYDIQAQTNLSQKSSWVSIGTVTGVDGETTYPVPSDASPSRFFRVLFPQPELSAGEPAFVSGSGGNTFYITGQFFYPGDQIRVGTALHKEACDLLDRLWTARQTVPAGAEREHR